MVVALRIVALVADTAFDRVAFSQDASSVRIKTLGEATGDDDYHAASPDSGEAGSRLVEENDERGLRQGRAMAGRR